MATRKRTKPKSLAHGRPPTVKPASLLSSKATRTLIRTYHTLEKRKAQAVAVGDDIAVVKIQQEIEAQGGIEKYQRASLLGQGNERGGDSSRILLNWMKRLAPELKVRKDHAPLRLLEVGALSISNACSRSGLFEIERIDLNSQAEGITRQDFMERPFPKLSTDKFEIISLSLVLNYVPDPASRGEMLKRTLKFLQMSPVQGEGNHGQCFPSLFLVLPASCVTNSRYMDESRLEAIMKSLGYVVVQQKLSNKLVYYLWRATDLAPRPQLDGFKKVEVRAGKTRNNFAIVLK